MLADFRKYLTSHTTLVKVLCILPLLISVLFTVFFSIDVVKTYNVLQYNDKLITESKYIYKIDTAIKNEDATTKVTTVASFNKTIEPTTDELIHISMYQGNIVYSVANNPIISTHRIKSNLILDYFKETDSTYIVVLKDNTELVVEENVPFLTIKTNNEGTYTICGDGIEEFTVDFVDSIIYDGNSYLFTDSYSCDVDIENNTCPCTVLETDGIYLDVESNQILQNTSSMFVWEFFLQTKILFVALMVIAIVLLCELLTKREEFMNSIPMKYYRIGYICTISLLVLAALCGYMLLAVF